MFDEQKLLEEQRQKLIDDFVAKLEQYDTKREVEMRAGGWEFVKTAERTVTFSFGLVNFCRKVYRKDAEWCYPVDDYLALEPYSRFSEEILFQIVDVATGLSFRKGAKAFTNLKNIDITKDVVLKARKFVTKLQKQKKEYDYYRDKELLEKLKVDTLYLEGGGVMVKAFKEKENEVAYTDMAHFVVHEGVTKDYGSRKKTVEKHETISLNLDESRDEVVAYIDEHYDITPDTLLITNSDMGRGYHAAAFEDIAALFRCKHEHFWDRYHLNLNIKKFFKTICKVHIRGYELKNRLFEAIKHFDIDEAQLILDTGEALITDDEELEKFQKFSRKLINNFEYTKPAHLRGLSGAGIGVIEAQHVKITDRMKHRGMYWSLDGAETMAKMIIDSSLGKLRELFFGDWRKEYEKIKALPTSAATFLKKSHTTSTVNKGMIISRRIRKGYN
ncbi:ISLre2 family transposase [Pseudolactococcus yaeyamensis]